jgi:glycosyltransferase involved in cell wall biosynthesis
MRRTFEYEVTKLNPSIVHAHDLVMLPAGVAAARSVGARLIYDAHELEVHRNTRAGVVDKWMRYYLERKNIKRCDATVTVCDSIADHLARAYAIERPVVVMNAPDVEQVIPSDRDLRSSLKLSKDTPLAVYVGRITIGRGIEQIVEALQRLPEFHLALVGTANKPTVDAAVERAAALGLAHRLHILAPVPPSEVVSFIGSGDLSLVPIQNVCLSYYYCLPNKLLESAIAGLPVVASDLPELKRFVEISGCGLIMDQTDPDDIARAMSEAYESRDRLRPDAERLQRAERIYGWASQKDKLSALYASFGLLPSQSSVQEPAAEDEARLRA